MRLPHWVHQADQARLAFFDGVRRRWAAMPKLWRVLAGIAGIVALYSLPMFDIPILATEDSDFAFVLFGCAWFVLVAIGLNVVIGLAGLLDLGYVGFFATGAYSVAVFGSPESELHKAWPWLACVPIAIAVSLVAGVVLGAPTLRLRGDYLALVTLGFGEIVRLFAVNSTFLGGARGIPNVPRPPGTKDDGTPLFNPVDGKPYYWLALTVVLICVYGVIRLQRSRVGRAWLAIREDEDAAEHMGVPTFKFKLWAFAIGAAIGGMAGALYAGQQAFLNSESIQLQMSFLFVAAVVIGGQGNLLGVTIGAILCSYLPTRFSEFAEYRFVVFGLVLIVIMIFRPQGLIPSRRRATELKDRQEEVMAGG